MCTKTFMFFIILVTTWKNAHSAVDCNNQNFLCETNTTFWDCIDNGVNTYTDPATFPVNTCASGTICDKNQPSPCASFTPLPTTVKVTTNTTIKPTVKPTVNTTVKPTVNTTVKPTVNTTIKPTVNTTVKPTVNTTVKPTLNTTIKPTVNTTVKPTVNTTIKPTVNTTVKPTVNTTGWNFNCTIAGRFPNTHSIDCKGYIICTLNLLGKLIASFYSCPNMTIFSPSSLKCTLASMLACTRVTTTTPRVTLQPPICKENVRCSNPLVPDCKGYAITITDPNGNRINVFYLCPPPSIFNPLTMKCTISSSYKCPSNVTTVKPTTRRVTVKPTTRRVTTTTKRPTRCTAVGKISDTSVANCKGYIMCSRDISGSFVETKYNCPLFSVFDPLNKICSISYQCTPPCTKAGRFADPSVPGCKGYTICSPFLLVYIQTKYICVSGTVFNPLTKICTLSSVYTCPN